MFVPETFFLSPVSWEDQVGLDRFACRIIAYFCPIRPCPLFEAAIPGVSTGYTSQLSEKRSEDATALR